VIDIVPWLDNPRPQLQPPQQPQPRPDLRNSWTWEQRLYPRTLDRIHAQRLLDLRNDQDMAFLAWTLRK
jgi:hypothetical protein